MEKQKKVLIAPLNWGLGHASRCIPIIDQYKRDGWEVILASDGGSLSLLKKSFPDLESHELPGYDIRYSKDARLITSVFFQLPRLWKRIREEFLWLKKFNQTAKLDLVISDNRYGMHCKRTRSVLITHQLNIKSPVFSEMINRFNLKMIGRFDECWVPDVEGEGNLSGELSDIPLPIAKKYIGHLSSLKKQEDIKEDIPLLCILSGPEPQRTLVERELKPILHDYPGSYLIRGLAEDQGERDEDGLKVIGFADRARIQDLISRSKLVLCRSGYSSIMDLNVMEKKAILIPTPGQTEQEYLADKLSDHTRFRSIQQEDLSLGLRSLIASANRWGLS